MNSKKILSVFLVLLMTLSLVACNSKENNTANNDNETIVQEAETKQEEVATTEEVSKEEATIVVQEETKEEVKEESKEKDRSNYSYWVNFLNPDGSVIERKAYKYGETPTYPSNPTYEDGRAIYEFVGWDKKLSPVTMTQNYTAQYSVLSYLASSSNNPSMKVCKLLLPPNLSFIDSFTSDDILYQEGWTWGDLFNNNSGHIYAEILWTDNIGPDPVSLELTLINSGGTLYLALVGAEDGSMFGPVSDGNGDYLTSEDAVSSTIYLILGL